ncbi:MAG: magnesium transporter CorA family protein [Dehalococcoidia bacterium]|nr:magnesium transporter CorA family protein [Dehalococcoidia bacterium]
MSAKSSPAAEQNNLHIEVVKHKGLTWVNVENPALADIEYLSQNYPFHVLDLEDCFSHIQRPKIDEYDDYIFLVLHFPRFHKRTRVMTPCQVSLFTGKDYLVSVHSGELKPLANLFNDCQINESAREEYMSRSSGHLLYTIIDRLVDYCFPILNKINENLENIEDRVFNEATPQTVKETLLIRRNIIAFRRIIRPQIEILDSLESKHWQFLKKDKDEELDIYFGNIGDHLDRIWDLLKDYREVVDILSDSSNWLASHRIQEVMRIMAILATAVSPLVIITGIYGMNIPLPLEDNTLGLPLLLGIMVVLLILTITFFRRRKWL